MVDLRTERLVLHPVDVEEAERIVARTPGAGDTWADDFPFDGDVIGVTMFLRATRSHGDQQPFGHFVIVRAADGRAVGGIGFKGPPQDGVVEIGYGLAPSGRRHGFAAEAVEAVVAHARGHGVHRVVADTEAGNVASRRTLERAGFTTTGTDDGLVLYTLTL